ncbi:hypothetical protein MMPV_008641 [Pyropia vietnamensis]
MTVHRRTSVAATIGAAATIAVALVASASTPAVAKDVASDTAASASASRPLESCVLTGGPGGRAVQYTRCKALPGSAGVHLYWTANSRADSLSVAFDAPAGSGWAAFGWAAPGAEPLSMLSGNPARENVVVVGATDNGGTTTAAMYQLTAKASEGVQPIATSTYRNLSAVVAPDGRLVVTFLRPLSGVPEAPYIPLNGTAIGVLWAVGAPPVVNNRLRYHTARGAGDVDWASSDVEVGDVRSDEDAEGEDEDDGGSACFPAAATVTTTTRGLITMADLRVGDSVSAGGPGVPPSDVYLFTHADAGVMAPFVSLSTAGGAPPLVASAGHYVLLAGGRSIAAGAVTVGDALARSDGSAAVVTSVSRVTRRGLYNPQTLSGGLVVDGYVVSTYTTAVEPAVAAAALAPVRGVYHMGGKGVLSGVSTWLGEGWPRLAAMLPSGRDSL